jgi:prepilin signal peptidase PulO-like enzyme (type II secretory pathway)
MTFDHRRLRLGELVAGAAALLLFIDMFLKWYGFEGENLARAAGFSTTISAWRAFDFIDILLFLVVLVTIGLVVLSATARTPALPVAASVIVTVLGLIAALFVLYRIINQPGPNDFVNASYGAYLGLVLCLGIALGGYMAMRDEGTTLADARAQAERMVAARGTSSVGAEPEPSREPAATTTPGALATEPEPTASTSTPPPSQRFPGEPPPERTA